MEGAASLRRNELQMHRHKAETGVETGAQEGVDANELTAVS